jgi:methyl-accepting chemotaxis protein
MKLRAKLMVAPALVSGVLLLALGGYLAVMAHFRDQSHASYADAISRQVSIASVVDSLGDAHVDMYRTVTIIGSLDEGQIKARREALPKAVQQVRQGVEGSVPEAIRGTEGFQRFEQALSKYAKAADSAIDLSTIDPNTGIAALQTADADFKAVKASLDQLEAQVRSAADESVAAQESGALRNSLILTLVGVLAGVASLLYAWRLQSQVTADLARAVDASNAVAEGRFDTDLSSRSQDEIGQLMEGLQSMVTELSSSMTVVQRAAQMIETASTEIAAGNQDLSQRTEHTASSLQETASSMDQLTTTVRNTAESARSANELAASATQAALQGGEVMRQVVTNMSEIDAASRKINEIIGVIDGIAFQTNILALNAAVEAARAGEQGRGFAVVAGEVRSLAQRSANAAREIKGLIGSSTERVEVGSRLVQEAGASMQGIVEGVERVTQIIREITQAADQESDGIGLVSQAVGKLDQMTQQNAALVEESAAAAEHLKGQAETLAEVVRRFHLRQG